MKTLLTSYQSARAAVAGFCIAVLLIPPPVLPCGGSRGPICILNPAACLKSMVLTKAVPTVVVFPPGGSATFNVPINLFITCPVTNNCGNACTNSTTPASASLTVTLYAGPPCPPGLPLPPATATATLSTGAGTMPLPVCTPAGANNNYSVGVTVPAGTAPGMYCVVGTANVTFSDGIVLSQSGDTVVCLVEEMPGRPGVPRLGLRLISEPFPTMAPGDQAVARYRVTNNDPSNSVQLLAVATSKQAALRPQGAAEDQGVFAISSPFGDDFPIAINSGNGNPGIIGTCLPLPQHPYTQDPVRAELPILKPGESTEVTVGIRSYGQCADGSCSESTLRVEGEFSDGTPAVACAGMSLLVDTSKPSQNCGRQVNDCNQNGIPDALDIASRRSRDLNFNAMPDECEEIVNIPVFAGVTPNADVPPGSPIQVQIAFNEVLPMLQVWANGSPLVRTQFLGTPLWMGTIPADLRPGPQTVYFQGRDQIGGLANFIARYNVAPPKGPIPTGVTPPRGMPGDIITITGSGFGNNPDNLCVMIQGEPSIPLRVLSATDNRITARLGTVPPDAKPGPIKVVLGEGRTGSFTPVFPEIRGGDDTWVWTSQQPASVTPFTFTPIYVPPTGTQRYFRGFVTNGVLCVFIQGDWPLNARVRVETHFNAGNTHYDMQERTIWFAGGGTTLDCARLIKDLLVCAFGQLGGVVLPADFAEVAPGVVKLTVRSPNNQPITSGMITLCVEAPRQPVITGVGTLSGAAGDLITLNGRGFGNDPDDVCLMVGGETPVPMRVLSASDGQIVARVGTIPREAKPGPLKIVLGDGHLGPFVPIFPEIRGGNDTWVWTSRETPVLAPFTFTPVYTPPVGNQRYFHGFVSNGVLCVYLDGNWALNTRVTVETHFNAGNTHYDMQERTIWFAGGGTTLDCARLIKDLVVCAFGQNAGVLLPVDFAQVAPGVVKLTIRSPNNQPITSGMITICVSAPVPPVITDVQPRTGAEGDLVTILGRGFDPNPDNLCVVARYGNTAIPLRAVEASPTRIVARVGPVPPNAPPARIMVGLGQGAVGRFQPIFPDIVQDEPVWVWQGREPGALAPNAFIPVPTPQPAFTRWFYGDVVNGRICTYISGNWASNTIVRITARAHTLTEKLDLDGPRIRLLGAGTTLQCALRLQDILRCAFLQQAGAAVDVSLDPQADGRVKITVSRSDGQSIVWGLLTICVSTPPPPVIITDVTPRTVGEGDLVRIRGRGFGDDPDDLCVVLRYGDTAVPLRAVQAADDEIVARVGVVPPDAQPGPIMVGLGRGNVGRFKPIFDDIQLVDPVWVWRGVNPGVVGGFNVVPRPSTPRFGVQWFYATLNDGKLCTYVSGNWRSNTLVQITARAHTATEKLDLDAPRTRLLGAGTTMECARRLQDIIRCAFRQQAGTDVNVDLTPQTDGRVKITVSRRDLQPIVWGLLTICITQPTEPPVIAGIWDIQNRGLWRKEVRAREIARWYRHYEWTVNSRLWLNRRAEGVWITGAAVKTFTCQAHCILANPNGTGFWRIWRTFTQVDVKRFRKHYRITWAGHLNPLVAVRAPENDRFAIAMDEVEIVLPMEPADPNPATPINEAVMIVDETGKQHFLGERGFEQMPDTAMNPNGFQLATTAISTDLLPPPELRINEGLTAAEAAMMNGGKMAEVEPGVFVEWLADDDGRVLVDRDGDGAPDPLLSPGVLGNLKNLGLLPRATSRDGNELPLEQANTPLQLNCWALDQRGEVLGAIPGQAVIGPPEATQEQRVAVGAPAPMDPTVRELRENPNGTVQEVLDPTAKPVDLAIVEEGPPTAAALAEFNANIARQIPGFVPLQPPFNLCIKQFKVRRIWGIDRRVVFDTWLHHWTWKLSHHFTLQRGAYRIWLTKKTLTEFHSRHHHFVVGQPPVWNSYSSTNVRFFRVCYRVIVPRPNVVRIKIDEMHVVVPLDPGDPNSPLMLLSTEHDENGLFRRLSPEVLSGKLPDPLPVDNDGVLVEPIDPGGTFDLLAGAPAVFSTARILEAGMADEVIAGNDDQANELKNTQLPLYCWGLAPDGTIGKQVFGSPLGAASPQGGAVAAAPGTIELAMTPTAAIPAFSDEMGNTTDNPTMFELNIMADPDQLGIRRTGLNVEVTWPGVGVLQSADQVGGPYTDRPGVVSPAQVVPNKPAEFFRIKR